MERTATFTLNEAHMRAANRLRLVSTFRSPRILARLASLWVITTALIGCLFALSSPWREALEALLPFAAVSAAAVFAVPTAVTLILAPLAIRRRFRQEKHLADPIAIGWSDAIYEIRTPRITNRFSWSDYRRFVENRRLFLLFLSDRTFQILPKRALTGEQIADIRAILGRRR